MFGRLGKRLKEKSTGLMFVSSAKLQSVLKNKLILSLRRIKFYKHTTIGELYVNGKFECFTLEDTFRPSGKKIYGKTAIPIGKYRVTIEKSPRFKRLLPRLHRVPRFRGILIHPGNSHSNTEGCILTGMTYKGSYLYESRIAFKKLLKKLQAYKGHMMIDVTAENPPLVDPS